MRIVLIIAMSVLLPLTLYIAARLQPKDYHPIDDIPLP